VGCGTLIAIGNESTTDENFGETFETKKKLRWKFCLVLIFMKLQFLKQNMGVCITARACYKHVFP
jgi:hypothetical protein